MNNKEDLRLDLKKVKDKYDKFMSRVKIKFKNINYDNFVKLLKSKYQLFINSLKNKLREKENNRVKKQDIKTINRKTTKNTRRKFKVKKLDLHNVYIQVALSGLVILLVLGLGIRSYKIDKVKREAFNVYWGQTMVGTIRNESEALSLVKDLKDELCKTYDMDIALHDEISFEETHAKDELLTSNKDLRNSIKSKIDFQVYGYTIEVDGVKMGALKSKEEVESILNKIKEPYEDWEEEGKVLKEIKFVEDIKVIKEEMQIGDISEGEEIYEALLTSSIQLRSHIIEVGESFWTIALFYNMDVDDLVEANPDKNPDALRIGDEVKLMIPKPVVTVATLTEMEYTDEINYDTEIEYDDNMYTTQSKVKVPGKKGSAKIVAEETKHNGYYIEKLIVKEDILEEPSKEILIKGTKEPPKTMATGMFLMPTRGRISSRYGMRNGSMHKGLDIASGLGTDVKAADGGKVIFAGYKGSYGNLVEIDHENGYKTRYAHNSKILVKTGERVYKGQTISKMGSTGRSTGSHLHFEVLVNGSNANPSNFIK